MLIYEITTNLKEDNIESNDIIILAEFVVNHIFEFVKKFPNLKKFTIQKFSKKLKEPIPPTRSPNLRDLLTRRIYIKLTTDVKYGMFNAYIGYHESDCPGYIKYNIYTQPDPLHLKSILVHEMQHALDNENSHGKSLPDKNTSEYSKEDYLKLKAEINARFAQVLFALAKMMPAREKLHLAVEKLFDIHDLNIKILGSNDPLTQKKINRLKVRAYKFYDDLISIPVPSVPEEKQTWWNKIKNLIKKTINPSDIHENTLTETNSETIDIHNFAKYLEQFINKFKPKGKYTIAQIQKTMGEEPTIKNDTLIDTIGIIIFDFWPIPSTGWNIGPYALCSFDDTQITITLDYWKIKAHRTISIVSKISHELQHALDYVKSNKKAMPIRNDYDTAGYDEYITWQEEINARFTEVLLIITKKNPSKKNLETVINYAFNQHDIFRELYSSGYKGQRQYNKLLSRAYKFYDEMITINKSEPGWIEKIKALISKFKIYSK